ncbi:MAG: hypothetical protein BV456_04780 [Thermoplasmata archaeon M8B2D]|nr:MAG: hypothetical protein BV456_04780 [Thermoplasmata archaeon M8B2D]
MEFKKETFKELVKLLENTAEVISYSGIASAHEKAHALTGTAVYIQQWANEIEESIKEKEVKKVMPKVGNWLTGSIGDSIKGPIYSSYPMFRVIAIHENGNEFFVETYNEQGEMTQPYSVINVDTNTWNIWE